MEWLDEILDDLSNDLLQEVSDDGNPRQAKVRAKLRIAAHLMRNRPPVPPTHFHLELDDIRLVAVYPSPLSPESALDLSLKAAEQLRDVPKVFKGFR